MGREDKNFNIPRGSNADYDSIRSNLRQRIKNYEKNMPKQEVYNQNNNYNQQAPMQAPQMQPQQRKVNPFAQNQQQQPQQQVPLQQPVQQQSVVQQPYVQQPAVPQQYQQAAPQQQYQMPSAQQSQPYPAQSGPMPAQTYSNVENSQPFQGVNYNNQESYRPNTNNNVFGTRTQNNFSSRPFSQHEFATASHSNEPVVYKPKKRKSASKTIVILFLMIALIFGLSWALREFVFQAYEIPSGSMEKTIMTGDMVFAEKISYKVSKPQAGDIATFIDPNNSGRILIKRIIATEGQTVDIKNNKLYIDDVEQKEDYVNGLPTSVLRSSSVTYPYKVPAGEVWVMGDNRTNSQDSRYFGSIPVNSFIGKALVVYWPISNAKNLG